MKVNLVTTVGLDPTLLHHFIKYYKSIGIENFYIVVWGDSEIVKYDEIVNVLKTYNLEIYKDLRDVKTGNSIFLTDIYNEVVATKPDEWWIVADLDEFAVFPKPLEQFIYEDLMYNDIDFVYGIMLDRIGENGEFSELTYDDNIWKKFPNVGFISRSIRKNDVNWAGLLKGKYKLYEGQHKFTHFPNSHEEYANYIKDNKSLIQIHHFRWKKDHIDIEKEYVKMGEKWWGAQHQKVLDYMLEHNKIDVKDSRFLIENCPNDKFDSYSKWNDVLKLPTYDDENDNPRPTYY